MSYLYQVLTQRVDAWRAANYPCDGFPAIREILEFATEDGEAAQLRYLRPAQFRALETYQGGRLVKIVPFNHPLTPMDMEAVRNELKTRPTEERDVMVVCLGWQHDARAWVDAYNRNRPINKLHVVELRTDRKLGGIIKHEPLSVQFSAKRTGNGANAQLVVEIQDVVSPTIMQRLNLEKGVFRAQISDWRAVVDCILIDTRYDGQIFNVALADVPERKQDLVNGRYELPAPPARSTVAVKIIDMLGEELVTTMAV